MTFLLLVLIQFLKAYCFRSERHSLLLVVVYLPALQQPFNTFSLPANEWVMVLSCALTILPVLELAKWLERRGWFGTWR